MPKGKYIYPNSLPLLHCCHPPPHPPVLSTHSHQRTPLSMERVRLLLTHHRPVLDSTPAHPSMDGRSSPLRLFCELHLTRMPATPLSAHFSPSLSLLTTTLKGNHSPSTSPPSPSTHTPTLSPATAPPTRSCEGSKIHDGEGDYGPGRGAGSVGGRGVRRVCRRLPDKRLRREVPREDVAGLQGCLQEGVRGRGHCGQRGPHAYACLQGEPDAG